MLKSHDVAAFRWIGYAGMRILPFGQSRCGSLASCDRRSGMAENKFGFPKIFSPSWRKRRDQKGFANHACLGFSGEKQTQYHKPATQAIIAVPRPHNQWSQAHVSLPFPAPNAPSAPMAPTTSNIKFLGEAGWHGDGADGWHGDGIDGWYGDGAPGADGRPERTGDAEGGLLWEPWICKMHQVRHKMQKTLNIIKWKHTKTILKPIISTLILTIIVVSQSLLRSWSEFGLYFNISLFRHRSAVKLLPLCYSMRSVSYVSFLCERRCLVACSGYIATRNSTSPLSPMRCRDSWSKRSQVAKWAETSQLSSLCPRVRIDWRWLIDATGNVSSKFAGLKNLWHCGH